MASVKKPDQSYINTATHIREQVREAAESRDFAINEAHRKYPAQINLIKHARYSRYIRQWFAGVRKTIYRQLKPKYPNLTAEDWELLHRLMSSCICVESLLHTGRISIHYVSLGNVQVFSHISGEVTSVIPECTIMIIKAFKMARIMCAGVLTIKIHHQKRYNCVIRVW